MRRIALVTALATGAVGALAAPAAAAPGVVVCASLHVWLDDETVVDQSHCQTVAVPQEG